MAISVEAIYENGVAAEPPYHAQPVHNLDQEKRGTNGYT